MRGLIHSIQSLGAVDGPGLRTVVVMQGCPLRCKFCHSIDTTLSDRGTEYDTDQLLEKVLRNRPYWKKYISRTDEIDLTREEIVGGVTITGGDPLAQPPFIVDFCEKLQEEQVHTTVETSLYTSTPVIDMLINKVDLWMVSIKHMDNDKHLDLTGKPNKAILDNLHYLDSQLLEMGKSKSLRIRFVVIPGVSDDEGLIKELGRFLSNFNSLESVELLPYVTLGRFKWIELYGKYEFEGAPDATTEDVERVRDLLSEFNLPFHQ